MDFRLVVVRSALPLVVTGLVATVIFDGSWLAGARLLVLAVEAAAAIVALRLGWQAPFAIGFAVSAIIYEVGGANGRVSGMLGNLAASVAFEHCFAIVFGFMGGVAACWVVRLKPRADGT